MTPISREGIVHPSADVAAYSSLESPGGTWHDRRRGRQVAWQLDAPLFNFDVPASNAPPLGRAIRDALKASTDMARDYLLGVILFASLMPCGVCLGQASATPHQYRFGRESIPAAESDEPLAQSFSSSLAKQHLETAVSLWARQQQCVSCHTHGIYMQVRPALTDVWGAPAEETRKFVVAQGEKLRRDGDKTGSVPVQMAYIARGLAAWDSALRKRTSPQTDSALRFLFEMQAEDGGIRVKDRWPPLISASYYGTVMAAMAVADAPHWLDELHDVELIAKIEKLKSYLRDTPPRNNHHALMLLWASAYIPDLLSDQRRRELIEMVWSHQQDDGGWTIWTFATPETLGGGKLAETIPNEPNYTTPTSDGYQTGLAVVVLRDAGVPKDDPRIDKAVKWLLSNQRQSGRWWTRSLNTRSRFHFISYSGTAYAALALAKCDALPVVK